MTERSDAERLLALMASRRSIRSYRPDPPPRALIEQVLEAAILAPSASNKQPWRFLVVQDRALVTALAGSVREAVARVAAHVPEESRASFLAYGDYFTRFEDAPVVIVAIHRGIPLLSSLVDAALDADLRDRIGRMERDSGLCGTAMALQNLLLMAHALGLGASGMTGPLLAEDRINDAAHHPGELGRGGAHPLGFPDETPAPTERRIAHAKTVRWLP
ncbi:MAG: nitroreductase family protein [Byssovorax sp.]